MIGQEPVYNRYILDTNIVIYILKGAKKVIEAIEKLEEDHVEVYFSTIVEAENYRMLLWQQQL